MRVFFFFFNDTPPTEIYTLPLHDALPTSPADVRQVGADRPRRNALDRVAAEAGTAREHLLATLGEARLGGGRGPAPLVLRSEEHTSELQSRPHLACRLLLGKKIN